MVTYGRLFSFACEAWERLNADGKQIKLLKLNRIIPISREAAREAAACETVFFFEEGVQRGGIGEHFSCLLQKEGFSGIFTLRAIQDPYIEHAPMFRALEKLGLNSQGMESLIREGYA